MNSNFTQENLNFRKRHLENLGLDESHFTKGTINTGSVEGPYYISSDSKLNSGLKPNVLKVNDIDELKKLGGIEDERYEKNLIARHHFIPQPWDSSRNSVEYNTLEYKDRSRICKAFKAYLYGYSKDVSNYREILNKTYFPMELPVFLAETIVVEPGNPLIIKSDDPDHPIGVGFDTVIVKPGGQIICESSANVTITHLIQEDADTLKDIPQPVPGNFCSIGADGKDGGDGGNGGNGSGGTQGTESKSGKDCCDKAAGKGGTGNPGIPGKPGTPGGRGQDGAVVNARISTVTGNIVLLSSGGNGGKGGNGGNGGIGGDGGPGGNGSKHCDPGPQGQGGNGGDGGRGGDGGPGGDGHEVYFNFDNIAIGATISLGQPKGVGGGPGSGGNAGDGGNGAPKGNGGNAGDAGNVGANGKVGTVYVNGTVL